MNEMSLDEAYRRYQLYWMLTHGYSLDDVLQVFIDELGEWVESGDEPISTRKDCLWAEDGLRNAFFNEHGFNGDLFASKAEFEETEFRNEEFMEILSQF